ncbi:MAG: hypothetical protein IKE22_08485 [Atopobiaceae bacterium]|nr:hypothetical protein [Atopobiaceae bacterium]
MAEIVRIFIKGTSGYGTIDDAYSDKVTITSDSIAYEYKPYIESDVNRLVKWSYRTNNPAYKTLFGKVADKVAAILTWDEEYFVTDIGSKTFVVTYADKTRVQRRFFLPGDDFAECFALVKGMVPGLESVPAVLRTSEDY